jgi:hypothetical protein
VDRGFVEGDRHHVFLVPQHGDAALRELHRDLHAGMLQPFARADRPFQPHITIARTTDARRARELCARVNEEMPPLGGSIESLTVGALAAGAFAPLARIALIQAARRPCVPRLPARWLREIKTAARRCPYNGPP